MLIDIDTGRVIDSVPFRRDFDTLRSRLSELEFDAMVTRINELIDEAGSEIATAGWLPGSDWTGTPFEPIYTKAARRGLWPVGDVLRAARLVRRYGPAGALGLGPVSGRRPRHRQPYVLPVARVA